jgi:flagellar basal body-associated protein FliL
MLPNISTNKQKQGKEKSSYVIVVLVVLVVLVLVLVLWLSYKSQHSKTEQCEGGDRTEKS